VGVRENRQDEAVTERRIVIAAGGTAGHVAPALAVADALRTHGAHVEFVGGARAEAQLVPAAGYELHRISVEGVSRTNPLRGALALARAALAIPRARTILKRLRPAAVLGGGGYVTAPVGIAALSLRIPLVLSEADSHLGLANRMLAPGARCVCLAFPIPGRGEQPPDPRALPRGNGRTQPHGAGASQGVSGNSRSRVRARYRVTGRPIPVPGADRALARERFGIGEGQRCLLVFGGSLGARSINLAAIEALGEGALRADIGAGLRVLHISGLRDHPELSGRELPPGYDLRDYLSLDEFAQAMAAADLVIARAGGSVAEIAAYGVPAILIPYPHASADHQTTNARWMERAGAAVVIPDGELSGARLAREIAALLADAEHLGAMAAASRGLARPGAADEIAQELLRAAA
jgi:UDP-N-acetylglucosamine--N-acetylmuramyl-(pentapeptide) pyrophosphoryl-undecaprenol N-acetylglucosamine transferase